MPIAEITRAETSERARLLRVHSYDVALDLTRGNEVFGSVSVIRFACREPGATSYVDLIADSVSEITLNGAPVDVAAAVHGAGEDGGGRITLPPLAAENVLRVAADCRYSADGTGLHRAVDPADGKVYTYTKFEPAYARRVYANFEQPDLRATFTFHVAAPANWTVLSNQPATEPAEHPTLRPAPVPVPGRVTGPAGPDRRVPRHPPRPRPRPRADRDPRRRGARAALPVA